MVDVLAVGSGVGEPLEALGALERLLTRVEPAVLRSKERDVKFHSIKKIFMAYTSVR